MTAFPGRSRLAVALGVAALSGCALVANLGGDFVAGDAGADVIVPEATLADSGADGAPADAPGNDAPAATLPDGAPDAGACTATSCPPLETCGGGGVPGVCGGKLAGNQAVPTNIAVQGSFVYWTSAGTPPAVLRCSEGGCSGKPEHLAAMFPGAPWSIAVDAKCVYWTNPMQGEVDSCGIADAGPPSPCPVACTGTGGNFRNATKQTSAFGLALGGSAGELFWSTQAKDGGIFTLNAMGADVLATDSFPAYVAADSTYVYWTDTMAGNVVQYMLAGGGMVLLATGQGAPLGIAIDGAGNVYWTNQSAGTVSGTGPVPILAQGENKPTMLAFDRGNLYWTTNTTMGTVMKCAVASCTPTMIAANQVMPYGIAVGSESVYWTTQGTGADGTIMKAPK